MKITILGCGNAFSRHNFNQCFLLEEDGRRMLLDYGYQAPAAVVLAAALLAAVVAVVRVAAARAVVAAPRVRAAAARRLPTSGAPY